MSIDTVLNLIAVIVSIIALVIMAIGLGLQIKPDKSNTKNGRPSNHKQ